MSIFSLEQLRAIAPERMKGASDAELIVDYSQQVGKDAQEVAEYFGVRTGRDSGELAAGISSGVDVLQMLGTSAAAGVADIVGAEDTSEYLRGQAKRQGYEAYLAGKPALDRVEDLQGVGDYIDYAQYQIGKQLPIMGGVAAAQFVPGLGQVASAAGLTRLGAVAPRMLGGGGVGQAVGFAGRRQALAGGAMAQGEALAKSTMVGTGLGFGSLYQASAEDGDPDPFLALLGAIPYGLAEAVVPAALTGAARIKTGAFTGRMPTRIAKAGATGGATEAATELFQTELEIGIDGTMTPEEAASQRLNAAVAGGLVGGSLSTVGGIRKAPPKIQNNELGETDLAASPSSAMQDVGASIAQRMQAEAKKDAPQAAPMTEEQKIAEVLKPEFMEGAADKMSRGDRIKLTNERKDLQARLDAVVEDSPTAGKRAAAGKNVTGRKAKEAARQQAAKEAQDEREIYTDRLSRIDQLLAADQVATQAEANLSRAEQGIVKPEQLPEDMREDVRAMSKFEQVEDGGMDLTSATAATPEEAAAPAPIEAVTAPAVKELTDEGLFNLEQIDPELISKEEVAIMASELDKQRALNAEVSSIQGAAPKGPLLDNGFFLGLVEMFRSSAVNPAPRFYKGTTATAQNIEARDANAEQIKNIYDAAINVIAKNQLRYNQSDNAAKRGGKALQKYKSLSTEVETAMQRLIGAAGGEANVNALIAVLKKRTARKNANTENPARFQRMARRIGKTEIKTQAQLDEVLDVQLSSAFKEYKNGTLGQLDVVRGAETRLNRDQKGKGLASPLQGIVATAETGGLRAIITRVASWEGTNSPYAVAIGGRIKAALDAQMKEGSQPSVVFIEDTDGQVTNPSYNPMNNTVYIHKEASQEEILHESLHAVLQKFVYDDPDHARVTALKTSLADLFAAVDNGVLDAVNMPQAYKDNAIKVVSLLRELNDSGRELDAVLELVSYGTTMHEFRDLLKSIKSNPSSETSAWLAVAEEVWRKVVDILSQLIGVENTLANDVLNNSISLIEYVTDAEPTSFVASEAKGQTLFMADMTDMADTDSDGRPLGSMFEREAKQKALFDSISTKFLFGQNWEGKVAAFDAKRTEWADKIRNEYPRLAAYTSLIASHFQLPPDMRRVFKTAKEQRNIAYMNLNKLAEALEYYDVATAKAILAYLDRDFTALDNIAHGPRLKNMADQLLADIDGFVTSLPVELQKQFANRKFTEYLIYVNDESTISSHSMGMGSLATQLKKQGFGVDKDIIDSNPDLFDTDPTTGDIIIDGPMYRATVTPSNGDKPYTVLVSKAKYEREGGRLPSPSGVMEVDTKREHEIARYASNNQYRVTSKMDYKDAFDAKQVREVANAMRNTLGGIASYYAAKNFYTSMAVLGKQQGFVFDSVDEINELFAGAAIGQQFQVKTPATLEQAQQKTIAARLRYRGNFVQYPNNPEQYGDLAGKIVHGPVYTAMHDMSDRSPIVQSEAYISSLRTFKKAKTIYNFGTHITNVLSNVSLMILHDIPMSTLLRASRLMWLYETNSAALDKQELAMMRAFSESGAMLGNFSSVEIRKELYKNLEENILTKESETVMSRVTDMLNAEADKGSRFGKFVRLGKTLDKVATELYAAEDNAFRLAAFMKQVGDEMSVNNVSEASPEMLSNAGRNAREMFLDYDIDSVAVKTLRQTALPFISWTYAIIPTLGRIAVTKPWQMANLLASYAMIDMAASALSGDDDDEIRKRGPEKLQDRLFGIGPRTNIRIPFMGDSENPVYYRLGDYIPLASTVKGLPTNNGFMGMDWWPSGLTPSSPLISGVVALLGGVDPYTGNKLHEITDDSVDRALNLAVFGYNIFSPPAVRSANWDKTVKALSGDVNFAGRKVDVTHLLFANILGLRVETFNADQEALSKMFQNKQLTRDYAAAIAKYKREEMRSGNPNYAAMDEEIQSLRAELQDELNRLYNLEE